MENKIYCKAEISKKTNIFVMLAMTIISLIAWIMLFIPVKSVKTKERSFIYTSKYNIYGIPIREENFNVRCIGNAQEFVDKTLVELKKYKESVSSRSVKASVSSDSDSMDALLKLKNLLDQGLITQEEFDEKRKAFVNKI